MLSRSPSVTPRCSRQRHGAIFTLSLSAPAKGNVTVNYATQDGTAVAAAGAYTAATGTAHDTRLAQLPSRPFRWRRSVT